MMMVGIQVHGQYVPIACAVSNKEVNEVFEFVFQVIKIMITMLWFCTKIKLYVSVDCWSCCIATLSAYGWRGSSQSHSGGKGCGRTSNYWCAMFMSGEKLFFCTKLIYAFLCRRAVRRKFAPIDAYDNPVFQSLLKDLHTLHLYAVDLEAFCLLYGLFQVMKILLRFRTKLQQCNFFSGNGWRMPLIPLPPDTTATKRWRNY